MEASRFPDDYDGIVAGAPAWQWVNLMAAELWNSQPALRDPTAMTAPKMTLLNQAVVQACDAIDGVTDGAPPVRIRLPGGFSEQTIERLKALLSEHPGESQVFLHVSDRQVVRLPDKFCVDASRGFAGEVRVLFGAECLL